MSEISYTVLTHLTGHGVNIFELGHRWPLVSAVAGSMLGINNGKTALLFVIIVLLSAT